MGNSKSLIIFFSLLFIITEGGTAYTQAPPQVMQQQDTPTDEAVPQPEVPKQSSTIILENNHLSVEFVNANFGDIIKDVGKKAGFKIEGSSNVFGKKVTTKFKDLELDTGVMRLFSLVKESNYRIDYNTKGTMSKLKIYNIKAGRSMPQTQFNTEEDGSSPQIPTSPRIRRSRRTSTPPPSGMPATPQTPGTTRPSFRFRAPAANQVPPVSKPVPPTPDPEADSGDADAPDEDVKEIPYTPP